MYLDISNDKDIVSYLWNNLTCKNKESLYLTRILWQTSFCFCKSRFFCQSYNRWQMFGSCEKCKVLKPLTARLSNHCLKWSSFSAIDNNQKGKAACWLSCQQPDTLRRVDSRRVGAQSHWNHHLMSHHRPECPAWATPFKPSQFIPRKKSYKPTTPAKLPVWTE